ncbi:hypothetical protein GDO78_014203 [Eleutherodactylus coqui]|uniref:Uncharacterized protein n=1 Tax=Eleutherodactylus coqui TaxID=57060 RepID=A0A8J6BF24_ELECQ|nr:hypothetical protein GDO78_014203 [Eleutherodactylus coqui]
MHRTRRPICLITPTGVFFLLNPVSPGIFCTHLRIPIDFFRNFLYANGRDHKACWVILRDQNAKEKAVYEPTEVNGF